MEDIVIAASGILTGLLITFYFHRKIEQPSENGTDSRMLEKKVKNPDKWNTVILFPDRLPLLPNSPTSQIIWYLRQAQKSIYVAMFMSNIKAIENALIECSFSGIHITGITHDKSFAKRMQRRGIDIIPYRQRVVCFFSGDRNRMIDLMHHKYIVIDEEAVLTGSFNWTKKAQGQYENVVVITDPNIVAKYCDNFKFLKADSMENPKGIDVTAQEDEEE